MTQQNEVFWLKYREFSSGLLKSLFEASSESLEAIKELDQSFYRALLQDSLEVSDDGKAGILHADGVTESSCGEFLPDFNLISTGSSNPRDESVVALHNCHGSDQFTGRQDVRRFFADDDATLRRLSEQSEHRHVERSVGSDVDDDLGVLEQVPLSFEEAQAHLFQQFWVVVVGAVDEGAAKDGVTLDVTLAVILQIFFLWR